MRRPSNLLKTLAAVEPASEPAEAGPPANYLDLYGLSKPPFGGPVDPRNYILFGSNRRAFELLTDHLTKGSGVVLLQGEEGVGKTEMLRAVAGTSADSGVRVVMVSRPAHGRINLVQLLSSLQGQPRADPGTDEDAIARFLGPPRKALVVDDLDLMPAECVRLLLGLAERIPQGPGGCAMVLGRSGGAATDPNRPELVKLIGLARNVIRIGRLGPAEVGQYIERSLWIAGGTTRRLISADAMKLIVTRAGGLPGTASRMMEAALTAGFARGDAMITARTVASAMGRPASRARYHQPVVTDRAARLVPIVAAGLLMVGAGAFLYRGINDHIPAPIQKPASVAVTTPQRTFDNALSPDVVAALMKRGDQSLGLGDLSAARLLYGRAAAAGHGPAATALGKTYDPNFVTPGASADRALAAEWYRKAITLGDPNAGDLLKRLGGGEGAGGHGR